jgi:hypothetical protein
MKFLFALGLLASSAAAADVHHRSLGFALDTCNPDEYVGPADYVNELPTGKIRCCSGYFEGGDKIAACDTSSCVNNFGQKNLLCHSYGAKNHPVKDLDLLSDTVKGGSNNCPYVESDRAICDVSEYTELNGGVNCRIHGGKNNKQNQSKCLGKVKCQTDGIIVPKGWQHSDGTATGGGACQSSQYPQGTTCFYMGDSDNWKVCGADGDLEGENEPEPTLAPTPSGQQLCTAPKSYIMYAEEQCFATMTPDQVEAGKACIKVVGDNLLATIEHTHPTSTMVASQMCYDAIDAGEGPEDLYFKCKCNFQDQTRAEWVIQMPEKCTPGVSNYQVRMLARHDVMMDGTSVAIEAFAGELAQPNDHIRYINVEMGCAC